MEDEGDECELADNEVTQLTEGSCEVTVSNEFGNEMKQLDQILKMNRVTIHVKLAQILMTLKCVRVIMNKAFAGYRLSCFSHTIQLVVTKFDEIVSLKQVVNNLQNSELRQLNSI